MRVLSTLLAIPALAVGGWLLLGRTSQRADFVVAAEESRTLDPQRVSWMSEIQIVAALFEGLTTIDTDTMQPIPAAAERWNISPDRLTYTFRLRPDARWSNGEPVVAADFRFSWLRALHHRPKVQYADQLFVIAGAEPYHRSRMNDDAGDDLPGESVRIAAPDDATLRVELRQPCAWFLELTSLPTFMPVHPGTIQRWGDDQTASGDSFRWTRPGNLVGNGPYVLAEWEFKRHIILRRNPHYHDTPPASAETIEIYTTADPNAALLAYQTGRVDLVRGLPTSAARALARQQRDGVRHDFHAGDRFATYFLRLNVRRPPLDRPEVRRALALAIDKVALCRNVMGLGETPADTYVPREALHRMPRRAPDGSPIYYQPPAGLGAGLSHEARVTLARELLTRAGWRDGAASMRVIELAFAPHPDQERVAEAVKAMWERELGLRVALRRVEGKVLSQYIRNLDYDIVRSDWFGDYLDPATFLEMFTGGSEQNRTGWRDERYDRLVADAAAQADERLRFTLLAQAERILCEEELPIIPLFFKRGTFLLNPRFRGLRDNIRDLLPIHRVTIAADR